MDDFTEIAAQVFGLKPEEIHDGLGPRDIDAWDSLGQLRLMAAMESHFKISLEMKDMFAVSTIGDYQMHIKGRALVIRQPNGTLHVIDYTHKPVSDISWFGAVDVVLECSGKNLAARDCRLFLKGRTKLVVISATSWDVDKTLVFGFNHRTFKGTEKVISYGSCTVNAYVPLAGFVRRKYEVIDSDANVIHNIQDHRLAENLTLNRKFCTLEKSGPELLKFVHAGNFVVSYTVVPYSGVSMMDFRFRIKKKTGREGLIAALEEAFFNGPLKHLYALEETDVGPEVFNCTTYSAVFIKDRLKVVGDQMYLQGYVDTENSVSRYYDLVHYIGGLQSISTKAHH